MADLIVVGYEDEFKAEEVRLTLAKLQREYLIDLEDAAVVVKNKAGKEMMRVMMPVQRPTSCTFGNQDLTTLYITTASVGLSEAEIQNSFFSGDLFSLPTSTSGLPTHHFRG